MDPIISALLSGLICSLVVGYFAYRLGRSGQSLDRRREAKSIIRKLADEIGSSGASYLWKDHTKAVGIIRVTQIDMADELGWQAKRRFNSRCDAFLAKPKSLYVAAPNKPEYKTDEDRKADWSKMTSDFRAEIINIADAI